MAGQIAADRDCGWRTHFKKFEICTLMNGASCQAGVMLFWISLIKGSSSCSFEPFDDLILYSFKIIKCFYYYTFILDG